jgi:tRNA-uridine 2-sulfurtransferase
MRHLGQAPRQIVDETGAILGQHDGAYAFTVGQRRGLCGQTCRRRQAPIRADIEPATRTVTVGPVGKLDVTEITGHGRSGAAAPEKRQGRRCRSAMTSLGPRYFAGPY